MGCAGCDRTNKRTRQTNASGRLCTAAWTCSPPHFCCCCNLAAQRRVCGEGCSLGCSQRWRFVCWRWRARRCHEQAPAAPAARPPCARCQQRLRGSGDAVGGLQSSSRVQQQACCRGKPSARGGTGRAGHGAQQYVQSAGQRYQSVKHTVGAAQSCWRRTRRRGQRPSVAAHSQRPLRCWSVTHRHCHCCGQAQCIDVALTAAGHRQSLASSRGSAPSSPEQAPAPAPPNSPSTACLPLPPSALPLSPADPDGEPPGEEKQPWAAGEAS